MSDRRGDRDRDPYGSGYDQPPKRRRDDDRLDEPSSSRHRPTGRDESRDRHEYRSSSHAGGYRGGGEYSRGGGGDYSRGGVEYGRGGGEFNQRGGEHSRSYGGDYERGSRGGRGGRGGNRGYRGGGGDRGGYGSRQVEDINDTSLMPLTTEHVSTFESHTHKKSSSDGGSVRGAGRKEKITNETINTRPTLNSKEGEEGQPVKLTTNYFKFLSRESMRIYQYIVEFEPEIPISVLKKGLISEHKSRIGGYVFDGTTMYTIQNLGEQFNLRSIALKSKEEYKITVSFTRMIDMTSQEALQVFNIIMRRCLDTLQMQQVGRNFYDPAAKIDMFDIEVQIWPGYITSIRQHEMDLLLCVETSFKVMRTETVYKNLRRFMRDYGPSYRQEFQQFIIGTTVLTDYNNKTYNITDVAWNQTPATTFNTKKGPISFATYYQQKYNIKIKDPNQPMLISKAKAREIRAGMSELIALIPELCRMTGITPEMRSDFSKMRRMSEYTLQSPDARIKKLEAVNRRLIQQSDCIDILRTFNLQLDTNLVKVVGRILPQEKITTGAGELRYERADWTRCLRNLKILQGNGEELQRWCLIVPRHAEGNAREFVKSLQEVGEGIKFRIQTPIYVPLDSDRKEQFVGATDECVNKHAPQLIFYFLIKNQADTYAIIKKKCIIDREVPSQVLLQKTIRKNVKSVATKVAIQMACKIGIIPWNISLPVKGLMTIGFDMNTDKSRRVSYGALVATMDLKSCQRFFSTISEYRGGEELSDHLTQNVEKALKAYQITHNSLPARILLYRDGVGEGQLEYVHKFEVQHLVTTLESIYGKKKMKLQLAVIVVNKRINTRFFDRDRNPTAGTVIDSVVTLPHRYDFFLVSQNVFQGTVAPTSYNIIHDTMNLTPGQMQILTFKMCHLYYNWSGTTRVPGVCQFAHKLSFLVCQYLKTAPRGAMEHQLYYL